MVWFISSFIVAVFLVCGFVVYRYVEKRAEYEYEVKCFCGNEYFLKINHTNFTSRKKFAKLISFGKENGKFYITYRPILYDSFCKRYECGEPMRERYETFKENYIKCHIDIEYYDINKFIRTGDNG